MLLLLALVLPARLAAQFEPPASGGIVGLQQAQQYLGHNMRVLVIGAHPDDEDTELLTLMSRRFGAEAAYLSLNRGEGGQNLIGPELGEALGILRTEELLAARRLDGARQYFTRAYDFGFSKTLDDTWSTWPRDTVLKDVVRIVRRFRPQVVVSVFSGTPRDGHGQHQAAGWAAREAFRVAGDSTVFPELAREEGLAPFAPLKLYRSTRFDSAATTLRLDGGAVSPVTGKTYHQVAMASRSLHRSQDMGQLQTIGPSEVRLGLLEDRTGRGGGGFWDGVDTTLGAQDPQGASVEWRDQEYRRGQAVQAERGELLDARAATAELPIGSTTAAVCESRSRVATRACDIRPVRGATVFTADSSRESPGYHVTFGHLRVDGVPPDEPYYLRHPRDGAMYRWDGADVATRGLPFEPPALVATLAQGGSAAESSLPVRRFSYRWNDQSVGEQRMPVELVPAVDVAVTPAELPWRRGAVKSATFSITLRNAARDTMHGVVRLETPAGWSPIRDSNVTLAPGARRVVRFAVRPPAGIGDTQVVLRAVFAGGVRGGSTAEYRETRRVVNYPHIEPRGYLQPAEAHVVFLDLALPPVRRIAYVRGAADGVPEALMAAGFPVEVIAGADLSAATLARYQVLVIGPRAYEVDAELPQRNDAVLDFARDGGRVVVQYQQYGFFFGNMAPWPLYVASRPPGSGDRPTATSTPVGAAVPTGLLGGHDRVTDEGATVVVKDPASPLLRTPNRISAKDWDGWVQERGLYLARAWAPEYRTVIAMSDPGEAPLEGALLIAPYGKGTYIYSGLAFFRQLPAGVPGAFRLFANLLTPGPAGR